MERLAFPLFAVLSFGAGCALVLDFDGYGPGTGGSGGSSSASSSSGAGGASSSSTSSSGVMDCSTVPGSQCVPPPPGGWEGPIALVAGVVDKQCDMGWSKVSAFGTGAIDAPEAMCTCACDPPQGGSCTPVVEYFTTGGCQSGNGFFAPNGACTIPPISGIQSYVLHVSVSSPGACPPNANVSIPKASFAGVASICAGEALSQGGCQVGDLCAPPLPAGVTSRMCVYTDGDVPCPDSSYSVRSVMYKSLDDSRTCSPCACGAVQATGCGGTATIYSDPGCAAAVQTVLTEMCYPGSFAAIGQPSLSVAGTCAPSGGAPQGTATPTGAITACCLN